jgi:hypothetical protein
MNRSQLEAVMHDPASTAAEVAAAKAALGAPDQDVSHDLHADTIALLTALQVSRVADLNEMIFERFHKTNNLKANDSLVKEFYWWIQPSPNLLRTLGMSAERYWEQSRELAAVAKRPDAEAFARRKLVELEAGQR